MDTLLSLITDGDVAKPPRHDAHLLAVTPLFSNISYVL